MSRVKRYSIRNGRGGGRGVIDVLETGMTGDVSGNYGRWILGCRLRLFRSRSLLILIIIIVPFPIEVLGAFVFVRRAVLIFMSTYLK
jgi:hypothetical protein